MRFHEYGGSYVWANMPLQPKASTITLTQRQAIGDLCYDIAESINTIYGLGGSSAYLSDADDELTGTYGYSNSIYCDTFSSGPPTSLSTIELWPT